MENQIITTILLSIGAGLLLGAIVYFYLKGKLQSTSAALQSKTQEADALRGQLDQELSERSDMSSKLESLVANHAAACQEVSSLKERIDEIRNDKERQAQDFESIASRVLRSQSSELNERQTRELGALLSPLKTQLKDFRDRVDQSERESIKQRESLKETVRNLSEKTDMVSEQAQSLAKALTSDYKKQGNWGEILLESVLDKSGLVKNREYTTQESLKDAEGRTQRPDVVIHLPGDKNLIVDSKVSLSAYTRAMNAESQEEADIHRKAHKDAILAHVKGLSDKKYEQLYPTGSPDFVLMFIPIDTAFSLALETDPEIYQYAFDRNVVIVTASTLLATLKTVETLWRNDKQKRYALEIAEEAGKMYDKFKSFTDDLKKLGAQLATVNKTYEESYKKLYSGRGNLVARAEKTKELGAKASKALDSELVDMAIDSRTEVLAANGQLN